MCVLLCLCLEIRVEGLIVHVVGVFLGGVRVWGLGLIHLGGFKIFLWRVILLKEVRLYEGFSLSNFVQLNGIVGLVWGIGTGFGV